MGEYKLSERDEKFCQLYVKLLNASEAYRQTGFGKKSSERAVNTQASEKLKMPKIARRIEELQAAAARIANEKFAVTAEEMLRHLDILRNSRIDDYVNFVKKSRTWIDDDLEEHTEEWTVLEFKPFDELTDEQLKCIESIKQTRYGIELKLHGKEWTIEKINKHIGFYAKDNEQTKPETVINWNEQKTYEEPKKQD